MASLTQPAASRASSEWRLRLGVVLLIALGLRLITLSPFLGAKAVFDEAYYLSVASDIREGRGHTNGLSGSEEPSAGKPPLYPALLAGLQMLWGRDPTLLRSFQIVPSLITVALVFSMAARRYGTRAGLASGLFCALSPSLVHYSHLIWPESLAALLVALFFWFVERYDRLGRLRDIALAGVVLGVSALNKGVWVYFGVLVIGWLLFRKRDLRAAAAPAALFAVAAAVVILPWTARNHRELDRVVLVANQTWFASAVGNLYPVDDWYLGSTPKRERQLLMAAANQYPEFEREDFYREVALQVIGDHQPWWIFQKMVRAPAALYGLESGQLRFVENGWIDPGPTVSRALVVYDVLGHYATLIPAVVALWVIPGGPVKWLAVLAVLYLNGIHVLANAFPRYHVVMLPIVFTYAGALAARSFDAKQVATWRWVGAAASAAAFVLIPLPRSLAYLSGLWAGIG